MNNRNSGYTILGIIAAIVIAWIVIQILATVL